MHGTYDVGKATACPTTVPCSLCPCRVRKYFVRRYAHHLHQSLYAFADPAVTCVNGMMGYMAGMRRAAPAVGLQYTLPINSRRLTNTKVTKITSLLASAYLTLPCLDIHALFLTVTSPYFSVTSNAISQFVSSSLSGSTTLEHFADHQIYRSRRV